MTNLEYMDSEFKRYNFTFSEQQLRQFYTFYEMLVEKNKVMNLTGITEFKEVVEKHFLDSILVANYIDFHDGDRVIDMGTGAGFPGIPLKIAFPHLDIVLMDSLNKRILFLDDVVEQLELKSISTVHARAEELSRQKEYREQFDYCVSRAVANMSSLLEYSVPFVKCGGKFISYKSSDIKEEVENAKKAASILGVKLKQIHSFDLNGQGRSFVEYDKIKNTGKKYPRKAGVPTRQPL